MKTPCYLDYQLLSTNGTLSVMRNPKAEKPYAVFTFPEWTCAAEFASKADADAFTLNDTRARMDALYAAQNAAK